jgi:UDP-glucose 4-epimerase
MNRILVTGATGAVGPRVVQILREAGYQIRTLSIDPPDPDLFPDGVEVLIGDVTDPSVVKSAVQGIKTIVHMASLLHIVNPPPTLRKEYEKVNVGGTDTVVQAALRENVERVIFFSTIAVYGNTANQIITENTPPYPDTFYAQTKLTAEKIVLQAQRTNGQPLGTVLRFGAVYGPRVKGNYRRLLLSLKQGKFIPIGDGHNRRTLIYDRDVAKAVLLTIEHPEAAGQVYNVSDGNFHTLNEIIRVMCKALDRSPPRISLPVKPVRWTISVLEVFSHLFGINVTIGRDMVDKYIEDIAVDSQRIRIQLGFEPQYGLVKGWEETIREMKQNGYL